MRIKMEISDLVRGLRAVALATGGKRYPDMLIELDDSMLHFVASDGSWMIEWRYEVRYPATGTARVGVCGRSLAAALPAIIRFENSDDAMGSLLLTDSAGYAGGKGLDPIRIESGLGAVTINGVALSEIPLAEKYEALLRPMSYPKPEQYFAGGAGNLAQVAEAFSLASPDGVEPVLLWRAGGARDPVFVTSEVVPELTALLMPYMADGRDPKP